YGLMASSDSNPPLALSSEHQGQLTDTEIKTLARLARKLIGEPPEKQSQSDGKKRKLYWWELDYDKLEYMSPRERAAYVEQHKQRVESEYRWLAKQQRAS